MNFFSSIGTPETFNRRIPIKIGDIIVKTTGFDFDDTTIIEKKAVDK